MNAENKSDKRGADVHGSALERIRNQVVSGELPAGELIDELALSHALGISRTPVREALKVLVAEGLVERLPHRGSRVRVPSRTEIRDLFAIVAALERLAAETIAREAIPETLTALRALHDDMVRQHAARDREAYFELNHQIHESIIAFAGNAELTRVHQDLMTRARRPRFIAITSDARWNESMKEHELIMMALETGNSAFAGELLGRHVLKTGEAYLGVLPEEEDG